MDTDRETPIPPAGNGTILLVEDDENVRSMATQMLKILGYTVFPAASPQEALAICTEAARPIDCVVTDVIMPGMSGRELVEKVSALRPGIRTLYMSGYTSDVIAHHGVLDEGVFFIQKPFDMNSIHKKIQEVMNAAPPDRAPGFLPPAGAGPGGTPQWAGRSRPIATGTSAPSSS